MKQLFCNSNTNSFLETKLIDQYNGQSISIASPFFTENKFLDLILEKKGSLRLIVRLCAVTSYNALLKALRSDNIEIRYFTGRKFHSKMYIFEGDYALVGSSNFTQSGLMNNMELNIGISNTDSLFNELNDLFEEYWVISEKLTEKTLEVFGIIIDNYKGDHKSDDNTIDKSISEAIDELNRKKENQSGDKKSFSEEHKRKISEANKGRIGKPLTEERRRQLAEATSKSLSKPVVCINTAVKYESLQEAAIKVYKNRRSYGYISDVCKGIKPHFKKNIWRYEEDYIKISENELIALKGNIQELNKKNYKCKIKTKTKLLFRGKVYEVFGELGKYLFEEGLLRNNGNNKAYLSRFLSAMINQSKKKECPFLKLPSGIGYEYIFFADYELSYQDNKRISEEPIGKSLEELEEFYIEKFDIEIGDLCIVDLLNSENSSFYKLDGQYFKSKNYITENCAYDKILDKNTVISLKDNEKYIFMWNVELEEMLKTNKNIFYQKNEYVFWNKNDYINKYIIEISKKDILIELALLY